ncbi:MAG: hypothetical protein JXX28_04045 [Deltaproteobacteria bacterium]|nr:hypothetical protein [Deltaproteobacteria bacterium]
MGFLIWLLACNSPETPADTADTGEGPAPVEVRGVAVSPDDGAPLVGARVVLQGQRGAAIGETDADGAFALSVVEPSMVTVFAEGRTAVSYAGLAEEPRSQSLVFPLAWRSPWDAPHLTLPVHLVVDGQEAGTRVCARWSGIVGEHCVNSPGNDPLDLSFEVQVAPDVARVGLVVVQESVAHGEVQAGASLVWLPSDTRKQVELSAAEVRTLTVRTNQPEVADAPLDSVDAYHRDRAASVHLQDFQRPGATLTLSGRARAVEVVGEELVISLPYLGVRAATERVSLDLSRTYATGHRALADLPLAAAEGGVALLDGPDVAIGAWSLGDPLAWHAAAGAEDYRLALYEGEALAWEVFTHQTRLELPALPEDVDASDLFTSGTWELSSRAGARVGWARQAIDPAEPRWETITRGGSARW